LCSSISTVGMNREPKHDGKNAHAQNKQHHQNKAKPLSYSLLNCCGVEVVGGSSEFPEGEAHPWIFFNILYNIEQKLFYNPENKCRQTKLCTSWQRQISANVNYMIDLFKQFEHAETTYPVILKCSLMLIYQKMH
jgi:hypothetical protein